MLYRVTQLAIHVVVTNAFLRSLARLDLAPSAVGALRARSDVAEGTVDETRRRKKPRADAQPKRAPLISRSLARSCRADTRRTVPERERITSDSVVAPAAVEVHALEHVAVRHAGGGEEDVVAAHQTVHVEHLVEVVAGVERRLALVLVARPQPPEHLTARGT